MNNSALAQIETGSSSRKFAAPSGTNSSANSQTAQKIYKKGSGVSTSDPASGASKSRRGISNTDKNAIWANQNLNNTGGSTQAAGPTNGSSNGQRKNSGSGTVGGRKSSLEQKFTGFPTNNHHRQLSDISQQNLIGYKGIGQNLGGKSIGDQPATVGLTSKLQQQPTMNEHASMPVMNTQGHQPRFISQGGGQGPSATSGQINASNGADLMPSFIQRQQQQIQNKFTGGVGANSNQQKKAQAYLQN